jgi:hypothetical protein
MFADTEAPISPDAEELPHNAERRCSTPTRRWTIWSTDPGRGVESDLPICLKKQSVQSSSRSFEGPPAEPPVDEPETEAPPVDEPVTDEPPAEELPQYELPVDEPPADEPPAEAPPPMWLRAAIE